MADRLTQLQDSLDDLLIRMYATLNYIQTYHPYGEIPGQPSQAPQAEDESRNDTTARTIPAVTNGNPPASAVDITIKSEDVTPGPDTPDKFRLTLRELAQDLVLQEQKTEILINQLPGLGNSERDQMRRMQELENELAKVEIARAEAEKQKEIMLKQLDSMISSFVRQGQHGD